MDEDDRIEAAMRHLVAVQQKQAAARAAGAARELPAAAIATAPLRRASAPDAHSDALAKLAGALRAAPGGCASQLDARVSALRGKLVRLAPIAPVADENRAPCAALGEAVVEFLTHAEPSLRCTALGSVRLQLVAAGASDHSRGAADPLVAAAAPAVEAALADADADVAGAATEALAPLLAVALTARGVGADTGCAAMRSVVRAALAHADRASARADARARRRAVEALARAAALDVPSALPLIVDALAAGAAPAAGGLRLRLDVLGAIAAAVRSARLRALPSDAACALEGLLCAAGLAADEPTRSRAAEVAEALDARSASLQAGVAAVAAGRPPRSYGEAVRRAVAAGGTTVHAAPPRSTSHAE